MCVCSEYVYAHRSQKPPISVINQENALQVYLQAIWWGQLFSREVPLPRYARVWVRLMKINWHILSPRKLHQTKVNPKPFPHFKVIIFTKNCRKQFQ